MKLYILVATCIDESSGKEEVSCISASSSLSDTKFLAKHANLNVINVRRELESFNWKPSKKQCKNSLYLNEQLTEGKKRKFFKQEANLTYKCLGPVEIEEELIKNAKEVTL